MDVWWMGWGCLGTTDRAGGRHGPAVETAGPRGSTEIGAVRDGGRAGPTRGGQAGTTSTVIGNETSACSDAVRLC